MHYSLTIFTVVLLATLMAVWAAPGPGADKIKLSFKVSARDLKSPDLLGRVNPIVKVFYTENDSSSEEELGESTRLSDTHDPDWPETFTFDFDRARNQKWHFIIKTRDLFGLHENEGEAWVTVSDYVDNNQSDLSVDLNKEGYLIVKKA